MRYPALATLPFNGGLRLTIEVMVVVVGEIAGEFGPFLPPVMECSLAFGPGGGHDAAALTGESILRLASIFRNQARV